MQKSDQINELATALAKAQSEIEIARKSADNPFFKSKYANLPAVWKAAKSALTKNGIAVSQATDVTEHGIILETVLMHSSGQWISSRYPVNPIKNDPQAIGSALTYARRNALSSIAFIVADDASDDDGEAAMDRITEDQAEKLLSLLTKHKISVLGFCTAMGVKSLLEIHASDFGTAMERINAKIDSISKQKESA